MPIGARFPAPELVERLGAAALDVPGFVKNPKPLIQHLEVLGRRQVRSYVQWGRSLYQAGRGCWSRACGSAAAGKRRSLDHRARIGWAFSLRRRRVRRPGGGCMIVGLMVGPGVWYGRLGDWNPASRLRHCSASLWEIGTKVFSSARSCASVR